MKPTKSSAMWLNSLHAKAARINAVQALVGAMAHVSGYTLVSVVENAKSTAFTLEFKSAADSRPISNLVRVLKLARQEEGTWARFVSGKTPFRLELASVEGIPGRYSLIQHFK